MPLRPPTARQPRPPKRTAKERADLRESLSTALSPGVRVLQFVHSRLLSYGTFRISPLGASGGSAALPSGFFAERSVLSIEGATSNIDVLFQVPTAWLTGGAILFLRIYATHQAATSLVAESRFDALPLRPTDDGTAQIGIFGARGHPNERWDVRIASNNVRTVENIVDGRFGAHAWGKESSPDQFGETLSIGPNVPAPQRAALGYAQDNSLGPGLTRWFPLAANIVNGRAELITSASGPPTGSVTTADSTATQANLKNAAGVAQRMQASNGTGTDLWIGWVNKAVPPVAGDALLGAVLVPAHSFANIPLPFGRALAAGVSFAWSTNPSTMATPAGFIGSATLEWT